MRAVANPTPLVRSMFPTRTPVCGARAADLGRLGRGTRALTPEGFGTVVWVRMADRWPYNEPAWVGVRLDTQARDDGLSLYPLARVRLFLGRA